jgi:PAS domain S-box-containing protein
MKTDISELIDLKKVSELLEGFNKTTGFVTAILDLEGNVLSKSGWRQMCTAFHRIHPETSKRCTFSDTVLADKMKKGKKYHAYTCLNGLTDVVVPLKIKGQHVANLFSGQFFLEKPDVDFFRKQATDFGFDEKTYISALNQVPVVSEKKVKTVMDFLLKMTDLISELGVEKAEQSELNKSLKESQEALMESDWKFRALFESGPIGVAYHVMVNDAAGEPVNYYFLDANGAYRELTGVDPRGKLVTEAFPEIKNDPFDWIGVFGKVARTGETIHFEQFLEPNQRWYDVVGYQYKPDHFVATFFEITKRKQTEAELAKLSTAVRQSPAIIAITDTEGKLEYVNPKFTELTGYSLGEATGHNLRIFKSGEQTDEIYIDLWKTLSSGKTWRGEFYNKKKNGESFWESASISPIFDEKGEIINFIKVAEDITRQKRNQQIQKIIHNISNAVVAGADLDDFIQLVKKELGRVIDTTNFYIALFDEKTDHISLPFHHDQKDTVKSFPAGKTITSYVIKTGKPLLATKAITEKLIKAGKIELIGHPSEAWLGVPLKARKKVTGIFALQSYDNENAYDESDLKMLEIISHQISLSLERLKAKENTRNISRRLQLSTESASMGIWELDLKNNVLSWDKQMFELYGMEPGNFEGAYEAWQKGVHPDDIRRSDAEVQDAISGRKDFHTQFRVVWPNGHIRFIEAHALVIRDSDGNPDSMIGVNWDITDQKEAEIEMIAAKEKAEESDRLKSAFLANMSHEIRTPMNGILGFTELLKEPQLSGDEKDQFIQIIEKSGNRMLNTINDIINISKIEAGQVEVVNSEVSVNKILGEQCDFFQRDAKSKGIELIYKCSLSDDESRIITDRHKLESVLINLIKNAIKFTLQGEVEVGCILKENMDNKVVAFYVRDSGIGIPSDTFLTVLNRPILRIKPSWKVRDLGFLFPDRMWKCWVEKLM